MLATFRTIKASPGWNPRILEGQTLESTQAITINCSSCQYDKNHASLLAMKKNDFLEQQETPNKTKFVYHLGCLHISKSLKMLHFFSVKIMHHWEDKNANRNPSFDCICHLQILVLLEIQKSLLHLIKRYEPTPSFGHILCFSTFKLLSEWTNWSI